MLIAFSINALLVAIAVAIHFEALNLLTIYTPKLHISRRISIVLGVVGVLCAHLLEVWIFGIAIYFLAQTETMGTLVGNTSAGFLDCIYFSLTSYTSVGFGDITPTGWLRFLAGIEALTGLVLIAWTASFMFIEMQKHWKPN